MKLSLSVLAAVADAWTYQDQAAWGTEAPNCGTEESPIGTQSPIDIVTANPLAITAPLVFQGVPDSATTPELKQQAVITDSTWEVLWDVDDVAEEKYGVRYTSDDGTERIYKLKNFQFHSPSEHTIDGQHADMEVHMVHACYGNLSCATIDPDDENLVIAIQMNVGAENPFLASFWPAFTNLAAQQAAPSTGPTIIDDMANPYNALVPPQPHDFWRYIGSMTTPTCAPNVMWFIMDTQSTLSQAQLTSYRAAITTHPGTQTVTAPTDPAGVTPGWDVTLGTNNRIPQAVGNRVPQKYTSPAEIAQQQRSFMWHGVLIFACLIALGLCCIYGYIQMTKPKEGKKRAVKPVKKKAPEEVPLVAPPAPQLFVQPLQVPMTTFAAPQYQQQVQFTSLAPQYQQQVVMPSP